MPNICIPREVAEKFKDALAKGRLNQRGGIKFSDILEAPDTQSRIRMLEPIVGSGAEIAVNLIEQKLILKNKVVGLKNAIAKLTNEGRYNPEKIVELKKKLEEYQELQRERILSPKEEQTFLGSLADKILGTEITKQEAQTLFELETKAQELRQGIENTPRGSSERVKYGSAKVVYEKYIEQLKTGNQRNILRMLKDWGKEVKIQFSENAPKTVMRVLTDVIGEIGDLSTSFVATLDNSFLGRQGAITLIEKPSIWWNMSKKSFQDFSSKLKGGQPLDVLMADIYSRDNFLNGRYEEAKLFPKTEEQFPTSLPERIPFLGRAFGASEVAFKGSAIRARADLFDLFINTAEKNGVEITPEIIKDFGTQVNSITARGKMGQIGGSKIVNLTLWAPKMLKADWDILTAHTFGVGLENPIARKQAALRIAKVALTTAGTVAIINAINPGSVETDPRSSEFMKVRVGNTTINIPFIRGMGQIVVLISRIITQQSKNSMTGVITELNSGEYGSKTLLDVGLDFLINKTKPLVHAGIDVARGKDISGDKPTLGSVLSGLIPISIQNFLDVGGTDTLEAVIGNFLDLIGVGSNTYIPGTNWESSGSQEMEQFKQQVGDEEFTKANNEFNRRFSEWIQSTKNKNDYTILSDENKQKLITKKKSEIKNSLFKEYDFRPERIKKAELPEL